MKKRIVTLALVVALVAIAAVGTLAYFTDTDEKTNTFATAKVDITLNDTFEKGSSIVPGVLDDGEIKNAVEKIVSVTNEDDSEEAYVRIHIAIPKDLDDKLLLINEGGSGANWSWKYSSDDRLNHSTPSYEAIINGKEYVVTVLTYEEKLVAGASTTNAFEYVWMYPNVTSDDLEQFDGSFNIIIFAEGTQAAGFDSAYDALEAAFGRDYCPWNDTIPTWEY